MTWNSSLHWFFISSIEIRCGGAGLHNTPPPLSAPVNCLLKTFKLIISIFHMPYLQHNHDIWNTTTTTIIKVSEKLYILISGIRTVNVNDKKNSIFLENTLIQFTIKTISTLLLFPIRENSNNKRWFIFNFPTQYFYNSSEKNGAQICDQIHKHTLKKIINIH